MTKSLYGDRDTVGTLALKARECHDIPVAGDLGHELMPSLVEDLNKAIASDPYHGKPFYIIIHEKKDLQLTNVVLRRMITTDKRPYPEVNTTVFWTNPKSQETRFCWALPHQSSFLGYLINPGSYADEQIQDIKAFNAEKMEHFGFKKVGVTKDKKPIMRPIPGFKDRKLRQKRQRPE